LKRDVSCLSPPAYFSLPLFSASNKPVPVSEAATPPTHTFAATSHHHPSAPRLAHGSNTARKAAAPFDIALGYHAVVGKRRRKYASIFSRPPSLMQIAGNESPLLLVKKSRIM
jgi:hypothetical protein